MIYRIQYFCAVQMGLHSSVFKQMHLTEIPIKDILNFWQVVKSSKYPDTAQHRAQA